VATTKGDPSKQSSLLTDTVKGKRKTDVRIEGPEGKKREGVANGQQPLSAQIAENNEKKSRMDDRGTQEPPGGAAKWANKNFTKRRPHRCVPGAYCAG